VAAAALEQSVLESKDKDTLLEMAKALGVKASSRLKKADIIGKILDTTSSPESASAPNPNGSGDARRQSAPTSDSRSDAAPREGSSPSTTSAAGSDGRRVGPDGEPLADWEIALAGSGGDGDTTSSTAAPARADGQPTGRSTEDATGTGSSGNRTGGGDRTGGNRTGDQRGDARHADDRNSRDQQGAKGSEGQSSGDQASSDQRSGDRHSGNRQGDQSGNRQSGNQPGNQPGNQQGNRQSGNQQGGNQGGNQQGEGNSRRRRRRRKGRGGQDGPQGEDADLVENDDQPQSNEPVDVTGYLDIRDEGYGFLRINGYLPTKQDAYIPVRLARQYGLRKGDQLTGKMRPAGRNEKNPALLEVYTVNGGDPEAAKKRPRFEDLTALFPDQQLKLEDPNDPTNMTARIIDLVSPIGKGQRGIIVSPPKAGKTTVMKTIAKSIELNSPDVELIMLLVDERPEEVTDIRRTVQGEVISSTFDRPSDEHTHIAEMAIAKAKRMVEDGKDVVIMLDGITRLSRAYNLAAPASGRMQQGKEVAPGYRCGRLLFEGTEHLNDFGGEQLLLTRGCGKYACARQRPSQSHGLQ
jgi:transcription termination factor Rho